MNPVLELKGSFHKKGNTSKPAGARLPNHAQVHIADLERLKASLQSVYDYWNRDQSGFPPLLSLFYRTIIAKSNRMEGILTSGAYHSNNTIVGATFSDSDNPAHIITHSLPLSVIHTGIKRIETCIEIMRITGTSEIIARHLQILSTISEKDLSTDEMRWKNSMSRTLKRVGLSRTRFTKVIKDSWYIEHFEVEQRSHSCVESQIISLFDTGLSKAEILRRLGMEHEAISSVDETTWLVTPAQYSKITRVAPFLVSMSVSDLGRITFPFDPTPPIQKPEFIITKPQNEPVIGVIDTLFDTTAYFASWVETETLISAQTIQTEDYQHGTAVCSLIVDGPALNPHLDDGCGRFRIKHFAVASHGKTSSTDILRKIRSIVESNTEIKVWNLSLGSDLEIDNTFISPEAAVLDRLQYEHDIVFVVAGTNNRDRRKNFPPVGSPADSLNSLVVNACGLDGKPSEYSRSGLVLHFFNKPDVSVFAGDRQDPMIVYSSQGRIKTSGTSFAAPWIARKLAYLIHVLGFSREVAKALLLDSASRWHTDSRYRNLLGFGVVPTHINEILKTPKDEIRFVVHGVVDAYEMYNYTIPVPRQNEKFPFLARAMMCYFPRCSRNQGVDYPDTELDLRFGRMKHEKGVKSIDNNEQGEHGGRSMFEKHVRKQYRKWDNVKHLCEGIKKRNPPRKCLSQHNPNWGIQIITKERLDAPSGHGVRFGIVITLKELQGKNRIEEFIQLCRANNWFVNEVDINNRIDIYEKAETDIIFDEDQNR